MSPACVLCRSTSRPYFGDVQTGRSFAECAECGLVFQTSPLLAPEKERAHYDLHENGPSTGYLAFLQPALDAVLSRAAPAGEGLDFGCGPGPVLAQQLRERGYETVLYDPFYAPDEGVLRRTYDFITCTETAEHFADPAREFEQLASLLRPGGLLVVMTALRDGKDFAKWHYRQDPTHVRFYAEKTLAWLAARHSWTLERPAENLAVFRLR